MISIPLISDLLNLRRSVKSFFQKIYRLVLYAPETKIDDSNSINVNNQERIAINAFVKFIASYKKLINKILSLKPIKDNLAININVFSENIQKIKANLEVIWSYLPSKLTFIAISALWFARTHVYNLLTNILAPTANLLIYCSLTFPIASIVVASTIYLSFAWNSYINDNEQQIDIKDFIKYASVLPINIMQNFVKTYIYTPTTNLSNAYNEIHLGCKNLISSSLEINNCIQQLNSELNLVTDHYEFMDATLQNFLVEAQKVHTSLRNDAQEIAKNCKNVRSHIPKKQSIAALIFLGYFTKSFFIPKKEEDRYSPDMRCAKL